MPNIEKIKHAFFGFIVSHPVVVLAGFLLCAGLLGWQAGHFEIDASADTLLMKDDRNYIQTQIVNRRFSPQEFLLVAYKPVKHPLLSKQTFAALNTLSKKIRKLDRVESVRSIINVPLMSKRDGSLSSKTDMSNMTIERRNYSIDEIKAAFAGHPIYEDLLIDKDQTVTALQVLFKSDKNLERLQGRVLDLRRKSLLGKLSDVENQEVSRLKEEIEPVERELDRARVSEIEVIRRIATEYEGDAQVYLGGIHVLTFQLIRIIKNDLIVFGGAIGAMICLILWFLFRKLRWVVIPVVCCICSVTSTLGLFGMLGLKATVISSSFVALQIILTLAIVVHLIVQYREYGASHPEWDQAELVKQTIFRKAGPCFYAGFINLVGFASLIFSNFRPVISFGWMMSIATLFSIGVSLILFPALMAMFGKEQAAKQIKFSDRILDFCTMFSLNRARLIVVSCVCILAMSVAGLFLLDVENSFINYFRASTQVHQELSFIDRELGGSTPLDIVYTIPRGERKQDLVLTAETVETLQRVQEALGRHEAVGKILSLVNVAELAKKMNTDKPLTEYELTALYWTMDKALRSDLLGSFFSPEDEQARFGIRIKDATIDLNRAKLISDIRRDMEKLGIPDTQYTLTNLFVLYQDILRQLFQSQISSLAISFGVLTLTIFAIFRSLKLALIGITPNILSTLMVLGIMGWLGIPLDLMTIMIAAVAMGISVDDTIHYIHRYLEELRGGSDDMAVERTNASVAHALLYTTLIVILGFSLLAFSDFVPSILFGLLTALAMGMALIFDLTILPVLLKKFVGSAP